MAVRIALRFHSHCPHTARRYYKPPCGNELQGEFGDGRGLGDDFRILRGRVHVRCVS
ncbi:hypothetical protein ACMD2_22803 [Ananas comosus]|uniref:Uncharacterized protein n=1 Tax=Ananas comosus TaxID=4615 RepID=A0A199VCE9_ANACO|nr:hypothetical protein ACMD2_22803 [Ananas comosus]